VVSRFQYRIEDVIVDNLMPTPGAITDVYAGARHAVNTVMADRDAGSHGDLDACGLLLDLADMVDKVLFRDTVRRVPVANWSRYPIDRRQRLASSVFE
jgi:hypothetical protein